MFLSYDMYYNLHSMGNYMVKWNPFTYPVQSEKIVEQQ